MFEIDWHRLLVPSGSLAEVVVRGTVVYLSLFVAMRFLPRREIGGMGAADILMIVIIADAVQNAMSGGYESITEGLLLVAVIFAWSTFIDWLDYKLPHLHIAEARPKLIISKGKLMHENMRKDKLSEDEVMAQLRMHGLDSPADVEAAYLEGDGHFSVMRRGKKPVERIQDQQRGIAR
jgi:uncharacterized membrane protein YcaP (DUF421 family)